MKLLITLLALCVTLPINAQKTYKAISYNIRWNNIADDLDQWDNRKEAIGNFLEEEKPDFVGMQEVLEDQLFFLNKYLVYYTHIGVGRDDGIKKGEFCPIFYDAVKWQILENETIWLSETPGNASRGWDAACNRVVTYGLFVNIESGDTLSVFNTHFDHKGETAREESVSLLQSFVETKSKNRDYIVLGDFNLTPVTTLYRSLTNVFKDTREVANHRYEEHSGTFNDFELEGEFSRRIDYIFTKPSMDVLLYDCPDLRIDGRHLSDHFPIVVIFRSIKNTD
ncbi:endonuclease/exonuclease/phosphatase family protein [Portibacter lacus]|uniref:Endonuclease n=1 Tax=Portibacter lacus TaxID=1099794 RepID=A0AA37SMP2_9BACT|nr:endonuclease/exonuclease/phosphatase family protein [Portibacter lacus]GLR15651.1 endonuclease [Portibacter lacus]